MQEETRKAGMAPAAETEGNKIENSYARCEITRNVVRAGVSGAMPPPMFKKKLSFLQ
jgi:hypothetical protein